MTARTCPTCGGPIRRRPGVAGRWPAYCSRACRPEVVRARALIDAGALAHPCRGCALETTADREWCSTYCAVTFWQARYRSDRELARTLAAVVPREMSASAGAHQEA